MFFSDKVIIDIEDGFIDPISKREYDKEYLQEYVDYITEPNLNYILNIPPYNYKRITEKLFEEYQDDSYDKVTKLECNDSVSAKSIVVKLGNDDVKDKWEKIEFYSELLSADNNKVYNEYCRLNYLIGYLHSTELKVLQNFLKSDEKFITIDGKWGSGKSTFVNFFRKENSGTYNIIYKDLTHEIALYDNEYTMVYDFFINSMDDESSEKLFYLLAKTTLKLGLELVLPGSVKKFKSAKKALAKRKENSVTGVVRANLKQLSIKQQTDFLIKNMCKVMPQDTVLILDELDRLPSENIVKILNLVNYLENRLSTVRFILVYNKSVVERRLHKMMDLAPEDKFLEKYTNQIIQMEYRDIEGVIYTYLYSRHNIGFSGTIYSIYGTYLDAYNYRSYFNGLIQNEKYKSLNSSLKKEVLANEMRVDWFNSYLYTEQKLFRELIKLLSRREVEKYCQDIFRFISKYEKGLYKIDTGIMYFYYLIKYIDPNFFARINEASDMYGFVKFSDDVERTITDATTDRDINFNKLLNIDDVEITDLRESIIEVILDYGYYFDDLNKTTNIEVDIQGERKAVAYFLVMLNKYRSWS